MRIFAGSSEGTWNLSFISFVVNSLPVYTQILYYQHSCCFLWKDVHLHLELKGQTLREQDMNRGHVMTGTQLDIYWAPSNNYLALYGSVAFKSGRRLELFTWLWNDIFLGNKPWNSDFVDPGWGPGLFDVKIFQLILMCCQVWEAMIHTKYLDDCLCPLQPCRV